MNEVVDQPVLDDPSEQLEAKPMTDQESMETVFAHQELAPYIAYLVLTDAYQTEQDFLSDPYEAVPTFHLPYLTKQAIASASQIAVLQPLSAYQQDENSARICSQLAWSMRNHPDNVISQATSNEVNSDVLRRDEEIAQNESPRFQPLRPEFRKKLVDIIGNAVVAADTAGQDNQVFYIINDLLNRTFEYTHSWPPELVVTLDQVTSTQPELASPLDDNDLMDRLDTIELNESYLSGADIVRLCGYLTQCESSFVTSEFIRFKDVVSAKAQEHTSLQQLFTPQKENQPPM
jgi:hypothetical protein